MTSVIHSNSHPDPYPHITANSPFLGTLVCVTASCQGHSALLGGPPAVLNHGRKCEGWFDNVTATQENTMRLLDSLENGGRVAGQEATDPDRE